MYELYVTFFYSLITSSLLTFFAYINRDIPLISGFFTAFPNKNLVYSLTALNNMKEKDAKDYIRNNLKSSSMWLLVTSNLGNGRSFIQQFLGLIVMGILVYFCFKTRIPNLFNNDKVSFLMYLPYSLWISFAFILNLQIVLKYLKK